MTWAGTAPHSLDVYCRVWMNDGTLESHGVCRTREIADYAPHSWHVALRPLGPGTSIGLGWLHHWHAGGHGFLRITGPRRPASRFLCLRSLGSRPCGCLSLLDLDDPSLLRLVGGSWRASSSAAAALRLRFCSMAFSCAIQASGNQSLQTSHGRSSVQSTRPSYFRRHCWQR